MGESKTEYEFCREGVEVACRGVTELLTVNPFRAKPSDFRAHTSQHFRRCTLWASCVEVVQTCSRAVGAPARNPAASLACSRIHATYIIEPVEA